MADKFKFYNISKANEEITRLETLVADRDTALDQAQEKITAFETAKPGDSPELTQARTDLTAAKQTIGTLESKIVALEGQTKDANAAAEKAKADAAAQASMKAAAITAGQGQPPIDVKPNENPGKLAATGTWTEKCLAAKAAGKK